MFNIDFRGTKHKNKENSPLFNLKKIEWWQEQGEESRKAILSQKSRSPPLFVLSSCLPLNLKQKISLGSLLPEVYSCTENWKDERTRIDALI